MADNKPFFPGFEDDPKPPSPVKAPEQAKAPAFDPFAGVQVKAPGLVDSAPAPAPAGGSRPTPSNKPVAPPTQETEEDVKPGARKDLWNCPHCGSGNRPDRNTCRACGKSKDEPVVVPWQRKPAVWIVAGAAAIVVIVLAVVLSRTDLRLRDPDAAKADAKPRIGGSATGGFDLPGGIRLDVDRQISVCGRIAGLGTGPGGVRTVALVLGASARESQVIAKPTTHGNFEFESPAQGVVLACVFDDPEAGKKLTVGSVLSVLGETGSLLSGGAFVRDAEHMIPVHVIQSRTAE